MKASRHDARLLFCLTVAALHRLPPPAIFSLTRVANRFRLKQINLQEQFLMAYGGLRGAVSFSLVEMLQPGVITPRQMFVTSTLVVILFTVFIQVSINSKMHSLHLTNQLPFYGRLFGTFFWPSKNSCYDPFDLFNSFRAAL